MVRTVGFEPTRRCRLGILSPVCLPFHHVRGEAAFMLRRRAGRNQVAAGCAALGRRKPRLPRSLAALLASYPFPGNVSELREVVLAGVRASPAGRLSLSPFQRYLNQSDAVPVDAVQSGSPLLLVPGRLPTLAEARDLVIEEALRRANGNQSIAARLLGISQPALSVHLKKVVTATTFD